MPQCEALLAERQAWQREHKRLLRRQEHDRRELDRLTKLIGALRQKLFGTGRGEKVDHAQLEIELGLAEVQLVSLHSQRSQKEDRQIDDLVAEPQTETTERVRRYSLPDDIEERTERIILGEVLAAPEDFREIGQPEVTEIIDLEPAKFIKIRQEFPRDVRCASYINAEETPVTCLDSDFGKGSKGYLWVYENRQGDSVYECHSVGDIGTHYHGAPGNIHDAGI
jgi:hypothetical protein